MRSSIRRFGTGLLLVSLITGAGAGVGLALIPVAAGPAGAVTTYVVDNANDGTAVPADCTTPVTGECTLRSALAAAAAAGTDVTITLPSLGAGDFYSVEEALGQLDVSGGNTVTINGGGQSNTIIQAQCIEETCPISIRVLEVDSGTTADISGVTVEDGNIDGSSGAGIWNDGGTLALNNSTVTDNTSNDDGAAIENQGTLTAEGSTFFGNAAGGRGGAIDQEEDDSASMSLTDDTISDNTASGDGGAIEAFTGSVTITGGNIGGTGSTSPTDIGNSTSESGGGLALEGASGTISGVTFGGTNTTQGNTASTFGGGVYISASQPDPSFSGDTISDNTAEEGGGVYIESGTNTFTDEAITGNTATNDQGGGVYIDGGTNTFSGGSISSNVADDDGEGGGVFIQTGTNSFSGGSVSDNQATDESGEGGGFYVVQGSNTFSDETINDNTAANDGDGGGFWIDDGTNTFSDDTVNGNMATGDDGNGGGLYIDDGTNTFSGDTITDNTADSVGGGLYIDDGTNSFTDETINDNTAGVADTDNGEGGGIYADGGTATFTGATVNDNTAVWVGGDTGYGGGLDVTGATVTFTGGSLDSNHAYGGGGLTIFDGSINVSQADISSNQVTEGGGGVLTDGGTTSITQSTISNNAVIEAIGITEFVGDGGGIVSAYCVPLTLTNDTIVENTATLLGGGYFGTGCDDEEALPAGDTAHTSTPHVVEEGTSFLFDTISGNTAGEGGGNINTNDESTLTMGESIVANGISNGIEDTNCTFTGGGTLTSLGYNLIDDSTCGTPASTDIIGQGAQLGSLGNNGGPTNTEEPGTGSPAIGAIPQSVCTGTGVSTDQRGVTRPSGQNNTCTIGAVEVQYVAPAYNPNGYRMVANEGGIFDFGLNFNGSLANNHLNAPIVGLANAPGPDGYVMAGADGGTFALGGANYYGGLGGQSIPSPIAAIAAPPSETGYWLVAQNGKIYNFGSVPPLPALTLPPGAHIVGMASTTDGQGAWLTDNLGDVYAEGDAQYKGGMGGQHINAPVVGIAAAASGQGYILVGSDGGVYNYGTQGFYGSVPGSLKPGQSLVAPIVGIAVTHSGNGYWEVGADGGLFNYGDAPFLGDIYTAIPGKKLNGPIVGIQHLGSAPV